MAELEEFIVEVKKEPSLIKSVLIWESIYLGINILLLRILDVGDINELIYQLTSYKNLIPFYSSFLFVIVIGTICFPFTLTKSRKLPIIGLFIALLPTIISIVGFTHVVLSGGLGHIGY